MTTSADSFRIDEWLIEPQINRLSRPGKLVKLEPKVMDVLVRLSSTPGTVVSRDELFDTVWAGTVVTDDVLTRSISELRKAFGDDPKQPTYIETIPKSGYRLVAVPSRQQVVPVARAKTRLRSLLTGLAAALLVIVAIVLTQSSIFQPAPQAYHAQPVTANPGREGPPELSPDGRQVAFGWRGEDGDNLDIYVKYVGTDPVLRLTDSDADDFNPAWSPEGSEVAFLRWDGGCSIFVVSALGGPERRLASCGETIYGDLTWSPDGEHLAMNERETGNESFAIHSISVQSADNTRLTSPDPGIWGDHDPAFSPDGSHLAFVRSQSEGMQDVYVLNLSDGLERQVTDESRNIWGVAWAPDGSIIFSSNRSGRAGLWRVSPDGGVPEWVGVGADAATFPSISGGNLAYLHGQAEVNIWSVDDAVGSEQSPVIRSTYWDMHPAASPDGSRLAFTSSRSGGYELWVANSDGSLPVRLTSFGDTFTSTPRWSPDGRHIVLTARPEGHADLYSVGSDGADLTRLTTNAADDLGASWSSDGARVLFTSNRTGAWEVWSMASTGGSATKITGSGGYGPQESRDGDAIYFAKFNRSGIWRSSSDGSNEVRVDSTLDPRDWGSYAVGDDSIYLVQRGSPNAIVRFDLGSMSYDTLHVPTSRIPTMDPALSVIPETNRLFFGQVDRSEADIMWVEGIR